MLWLWFIPGSLILLLAWGVTRFLNRKYKRLPLPHRLLKTMRRICRFPGAEEDVRTLRTAAPALRRHLYLLRRELSGAPALPVDEDGLPRLLDLAHDLVDQGDFTHDRLVQTLLHALPPPTPCEAYALPLAIAVAQWQRLDRVLNAMLADENQRRQARRLLRRLQHAGSISAVLDRTDLTAAGLAELSALIEARGSDALRTDFDAWLEHRALHSADVQEHASLHHQHIAQELHRAVACLDALQRLRWISLCREGDPLHPLLLRDPADIYPHMDAASQLALRRRAEALARHSRLAPQAVVQRALQLAESADRSSPEVSVCHWFHEAEGLQRLRNALPGRKGRLYARFALREYTLHYACLWLIGGLGGFLFLQGGGPVYMLPFFALVNGALARWLLQRFPRHPLPRMIPGSTPLRTLAVMHAVLSDPQDAIGMARQLQTALYRFPDHVDILLLGDFAPAITPASSGDQAILHAAASALDELDDPRLMYLHRGRSWDSDGHCYAGRGGSTGALHALCRLAASGECEDPLVLSTTDTAGFERRYDYILALPHDAQPHPGMYEQLLGAMIHPHSSRLPTVRSWRGYSILVPEGQHGFSGAGLLRPDAFLEATDDLLPTHGSASVLAGELAGWAAVSGARLHSPSADDESEAQYSHAVQGWQLLPWQLPLVQTPAGLVSNPLRFMSRFRLREPLRQALVPLGQCALLLYGLLRQSPLLIVLALLPLLISQPLRTRHDALRLLSRLSLLPASAATPLRALHDTLRRQKAAAWSAAFEIWTQGIAAALLTGLGVALPGGSVALLAFGLIFACFPLAHRVPDAPPSSQRSHGPADIALHESGAQLWSAALRSLSTLVREASPSARDLAAGMTACVCARELGLISANEAARHVTSLAARLHDLSMPEDPPRCSAQEYGYILCALMTTAQGLRLWQPELSPAYFNLPALLDELVSSLVSAGLHDPIADEAPLLSVAACALGRIAPEQLERLHHTLAGPGSHAAPAIGQPLPTLFLPLPEEAFDAPAAAQDVPDDVWQQCLALAATAHRLADAPLRRIFCSIPQVAAMLPLLEPHQTPRI